MTDDEQIVVAPAERTLFHSVHLQKHLMESEHAHVCQYKQWAHFSVPRINVHVTNKAIYLSVRLSIYLSVGWWLNVPPWMWTSCFLSSHHSWTPSGIPEEPHDVDEEEGCWIFDEQVPGTLKGLRPWWDNGAWSGFLRLRLFLFELLSQSWSLSHTTESQSWADHPHLLCRARCSSVPVQLLITNN